MHRLTRLILPSLPLVIAQCLLLAACGPLGQRRAISPVRSVQVTMESYLKAEQKNDFQTLYGFFSASLRDTLRREHGVASKEDYAEFRDSSETEWPRHDALKIDCESQTRCNAVVKGHFLSLGEEGDTNIRYFLVKEQGEWKINEWEYPDGQAVGQKPNPH